MDAVAQATKIGQDIAAKITAAITDSLSEMEGVQVVTMTVNGSDPVKAEVAESLGNIETQIRQLKLKL
jgi:hypothetical protein